MTPRHILVFLCLAVLCLTALTPAASPILWAILLPVCFLCTVVLAVAGIVETEHQPTFSTFCLPLPARAPPVRS